MPTEGLERLQKVLAHAGIGSRRHCEELIEAGVVTINGRVATLGDKVDPESDRIEVEGVPVGTRAGLVHYLLNKPAGVVTSAGDPHGRVSVTDLVPDEPRVYPVGRLDQDTEGLLLLTNDGDLTHRLTHPSFGVEKEYMAEVNGRPSRGTLRQLRQGRAHLRLHGLSPGQVGLVNHDHVADLQQACLLPLQVIPRRRLEQKDHHVRATQVLGGPVDNDALAHLGHVILHVYDVGRDGDGNGGDYDRYRDPSGGDDDSDGDEDYYSADDHINDSDI